MAEKMLVMQALDERELLVKKIQNKIANASFTDVKKRNEQKVLERRMRGVGSYDGEADFEQSLYTKMKIERDKCVVTAENKNRQGLCCHVQIDICIDDRIKDFLNSSAG